MVTIQLANPTGNSRVDDRTPEMGYAMPVEDDKRRRLRGLCAEMPAFENHFLQRYREYLLAQLDSPDDVQKRWAVEQLAVVKFAM